MNAVNLSVGGKIALGRLVAAKRMLTRQQYKTIKGQILVGDVDGAMKGLAKIIDKKSGVR